MQEKIKEIELDGIKKVTRFSIIGYSLGGLLSRYLIGYVSLDSQDHPELISFSILHYRKFFETIRPVNFTTIASPHIGLPRYPNLFSKLASKWGPTLLSRTGEQFWSTDSWGATGKPLLLAMADKSMWLGQSISIHTYACTTGQVFFQALTLFPNISIYASAYVVPTSRVMGSSESLCRFGDTTVPFSTAFIQEHDPFINHEARGVTLCVPSPFQLIVTTDPCKVTSTKRTRPSLRASKSRQFRPRRLQNPNSGQRRIGHRGSPNSFSRRSSDSASQATW